MDRQHDHQLLIGMRRGDEGAARVLWSRFAPRLTAYARAILARHDPASAPDIVQQVFLAVLRAPRREARAIDDPAAWLLRLTRNLALNRVRSLCRERRRMAQLTPSAHSSIDARTVEADLTALIDTLPRPLREVITLKHTAGLTFDQMAAALAINRNTLAARYHRALTLLRERLEAPAPPPAPPPSPGSIHQESAHARS
jgi:RNA polymerase sigma-70 factor (ECF subfamily)